MNNPKQEAQEAAEALRDTIRKASVAAYNFERSFVENVKEISGKGRTAEEARKFWGLDE